MKSINVKIWVGPCSGVCQEWNCNNKKAKAESKKTPSNVCCNSHKSLSNRKKKRKNKEDILQENLLWCQNSEIEVNTSPSQKVVKINDVENVGTHNPFHT